MTKSKFFMSFLAFCFLVPTYSARAEILPESQFAVGDWSGSARGGSSDEFSFCTLTHAYRNGIELSIARSQEGFLLVSLRNPAWDLSAQSDTQIAVAVDDGEKRLYTAHAISSNSLLIAMLPDVGAIYSALFSTGSVLTLAKGEDNWQFDLQGMHTVMTALGDCVDRRGKMSGYAANAQPDSSEAASLPNQEMP